MGCSLLGLAAHTAVPVMHRVRYGSKCDSLHVVVLATLYIITLFNVQLNEYFTLHRTATTSEQLYDWQRGRQLLA